MSDGQQGCPHAAKSWPLQLAGPPLLWPPSVTHGFGAEPKGEEEVAEERTGGLGGREVLRLSLWQRSFFFFFLFPPFSYSYVKSAQKPGSLLGTSAVLPEGGHSEGPGLAPQLGDR